MFEPKRVIFEKKVIEYGLGKELFHKFKNNKNVEIMFSKSGRITGIPGSTPSEKYGEGKNTLVVGERKTLEFQSCKPSAHYQLPLVSGCMGMCEYCYLNTQMGKKPYIKIHTNLQEILNKAGEYIEKRKPEITIFEGAATSDPVPIEGYSGALEAAIKYFSKNEYSKFRFVTKYTDVDNLLNIEHNGKTMIRFSINTDEIIKVYEHRTPCLQKRLEAAYKISESGYELGFIIAPVFLCNKWENQYLQLLIKVADIFKDKKIRFEIISHRFTKRAKENIINIFPKTMLPMEEEIRKFKYGQFGYGKYVYRKDEFKRMEEFFKENIERYFKNGNIDYII
ncbi:spore photoproduct lyase [Clostridium aestuarii]|uniref:Spore photoproduct lyase n=1 Tax=Clostridium aestuarii TaxID=338193 RepID=A0ABT4CZC6_9CLOT|nr:spore photoproduct lyase [Clostridium aestuarii]MCY6483158.1 spore photoproduct lyase [Clostridium aestuarii]